jgi:hypothetical protein
MGADSRIMRQARDSSCDFGEPSNEVLSIARPELDFTFAGKPNRPVAVEL